MNGSSNVIIVCCVRERWIALSITISLISKYLSIYLEISVLGFFCSQSVRSQLFPQICLFTNFFTDFIRKMSLREKTWGNRRWQEWHLKRRRRSLTTNSLRSRSWSRCCWYDRDLHRDVELLKQHLERDLDR
jgi:hypothetical protein